MTIKHVLVFSGGQDSTSVLGHLLSPGSIDPHGDIAPDEILAVTIDYGQRHRREILAARRIAAITGIQLSVIPVPDILRSTSPLTDPGAELEQYRDGEEMAKIIGNRVERTFVPLRNLLFAVLAANRAVACGARNIWLGVCEDDNANYPDCRRVFIDSAQETMRLALGIENTDPGAITINTPLIDVPKYFAIRALLGRGMDKFALLAWSHTAYDGVFPPTGRDHATVLREEAFKFSGCPDPLIVRAVMSGRMAELPKTANYADAGFISELQARIEAASMILRRFDLLAEPA